MVEARKPYRERMKEARAEARAKRETEGTASRITRMLSCESRQTRCRDLG
jgi:hypothetical protein